MSLNGSEITKSYAPNSINQTTLKLFTRGDTPNTSYSNTHIKMYECKITSNGNLIRDFVPCVRKSDNEPGLYDRVNNVFYTNAGSGTFLKGNNASNNNHIKYKPTDADGYDVHFIN